MQLPKTIKPIAGVREGIIGLELMINTGNKIKVWIDGLLIYYAANKLIADKISFFFGVQSLFISFFGFKSLN